MSKYGRRRSRYLSVVDVDFRLPVVVQNTTYLRGRRKDDIDLWVDRDVISNLRTYSHSTRKLDYGNGKSRAGSCRETLRSPRGTSLY
jgi:hypothetical protein